MQRAVLSMSALAALAGLGAMSYGPSAEIQLKQTTPPTPPRTVSTRGWRKPKPVNHDAIMAAELKRARKNAKRLKDSGASAQ